MRSTGLSIDRTHTVHPQLALCQHGIKTIPAAEFLCASVSDASGRLDFARD